ncbi:UNVERIFIED_CONTAM: aos [Trichonephila clavipes]
MLKIAIVLLRAGGGGGGDSIVTLQRILEPPIAMTSSLFDQNNSNDINPLLILRTIHHRFYHNQYSDILKRSIKKFLEQSINCFNIILNIRNGIFHVITGESEMPQCERWSVCSRVDTYSRPWVERLCTCQNGQSCSTSLRFDDGHTVTDRTRQYKVCESVDTLPTCRFFKDITWTHITSADNKFQQRVHCKCPENSTTYISGHDVKTTSQGMLYYYHFSCSPESVSMKSLAELSYARLY